MIPRGLKVRARDGDRPGYYETAVVDGVVIRPQTRDADVMGEVEEYLRAIPVVDGDRVLDLGGHVGIAAVRFVESGASRVLSVEPEPGNYAVLAENARLRGEITAINAAAVEAGGPSEVTLYAAVTANRARGSLTPVRGRKAITVPAVGIDRLYQEIAPTYVKVDIEGAEFRVLPSCPLPVSVRAVVMEVHLGRPEWRAGLEGLIRFMDSNRMRPLDGHKRPEEYVGVDHGWPVIMGWVR